MGDLEANLKSIILNKYGTMKRFADTIDMSWSTLDSILKRGVMNANTSNIVKIAQTLNIDIESLAAGKITPKHDIDNKKCTIKFKEILGNLRIENNMSQSELAEKLNAELSTVASWEAGGSYPSRKNIECLADIFKVDIDFLCGCSSNEQSINYSNNIYNLSNFEYQLIKQYRQLNATGKQIILDSVEIATKLYNIELQDKKISN